jgi:hypothetical protein
MRTRTYSLIGALALAWSGVGVAADAAKEDPAGPLDPARVQSAGSGATGESGISETGSAGAVKEEGEEVRASRDTASHDDQHAKDGSGGEASGQRKDETATMPQGESGISSDSRN